MSTASITPGLKFLSSPASLPWTAIAGSRFCGTNMADIDGDGQAEVLATVVDPLGLLPPSLGALSLFAPEAFSEAWRGSTAPQAAPQLVATTFQPIDTSASSVQVVTGSLFGDGPPAIVMFDGATLTVCQWQADLGVQVIATASGSVPASSSGGSDWTICSATLLVGDIDGDGAAEIVALTGTAVVTLGWSASLSALQCLAVQTGTVPGSGQAGDWSIETCCAQMGDVDGNGRSELVVIASSNGVLGWSAGQWSNMLLQSNVPSWIAFATMGDLDGDGQDELVYTTVGSFWMPTVLAVCKWDSASNALNVTTQATTLSNASGQSWTISPTQPMIATLAKGERSIIVYGSLSDASGWAILSWSSDAGLAFVFSINDYVNTDTGLNWSYPADATLTVGDIDGDGLDEVVIQSDSESQIVVFNAAYYMVWIGSQGDSPAMLGWGVGALYSAPTTPFVDFTGEQLTIYNNIATKFGIDPTRSSVRQEYLNGNNQNSFSDWHRQLVDQLADPTWGWLVTLTDEGSPDINPVFNPLISELYAVNLLYPYRNIVVEQVKDIAQQRATDLNTVVSNLGASSSSHPVPASTQMPYWVGQCLLAVMWGVAATPGVGEGAMALAALASLLGSVLSAPAGDSTTTTLAEPTVVEYSAYQSAIGTDASTLQTAIDTQVNALLQDPIKLPILGPLLENVWTTSNLSGDEATAGSSRYSRYNYYIDLVPAVFTLWVWQQQPQSTAPWIMTSNNNGNWSFVPVPSTNGSGAVWHLGSGPVDVYMLAVTGSAVESPTFPQPALMEDLFTTIGAPVGPFLTGTNGWSIPTNIYVIGLPLSNQSPTFYMNIQSSDPVWITVYNWEKDIIGNTNVESMSQGSVSCGDWWSHCHIRGQRNGVAGDAWDTEIEIYPKLINQGSTATQNTLLTYVDTGSGAYWQTDN